jgi:transcriptional regulator with XRE-family HTH domain
MPAPAKKRQSRKAQTPIARRITELRKCLGLSQRELGVAINLDESVAAIRINQYERAVHTPVYSLIQRLAKFSGVPDAYFYTADDDLASLIAAFGKLDSAARANLVRSATAQLEKGS